jgi:hypothetical protein
MSRKQENIKKTRQILPSNATLIANEIDYLDYQKKAISKNLTAYQAYEIMTSHQPKWLEILFRIRDCLVKAVGIKPINGFSRSRKENHDSNLNKIVHFFTITEETDNKLTLVVKDSHLDVCVCIIVIDEHDNSNKNTLYLIASVKNHNIWGKLYMLPVSILHPYIVKRLYSKY